MTNQQMNELKLFFKTEVVQAITESEARTNSRIDRLETRMEEGFSGIADALDVILDLMERDRKITNQRLTWLERHAFGV